MPFPFLWLCRCAEYEWNARRFVDLLGSSLFLISPLSGWAHSWFPLACFKIIDIPTVSSMVRNLRELWATLWVFQLEGRPSLVLLHGASRFTTAGIRKRTMLWLVVSKFVPFVSHSNILFFFLLNGCDNAIRNTSQHDMIYRLTIVAWCASQHTAYRRVLWECKQISHISILYYVLIKPSPLDESANLFSKGQSTWVTSVR